MKGLEYITYTYDYLRFAEVSYFEILYKRARWYRAFRVVIIHLSSFFEYSARWLRCAVYVKYMWTCKHFLSAAINTRTPRSALTVHCSSRYGPDRAEACINIKPLNLLNHQRHLSRCTFPHRSSFEQYTSHTTTRKQSLLSRRKVTQKSTGCQISSHSGACQTRITADLQALVLVTWVPPTAHVLHGPEYSCLLDFEFPYPPHSITWSLTLAPLLTRH